MHAPEDLSRVRRYLPLWTAGVVAAMSLIVTPGIVSGGRAQNPATIVENRTADRELRGSPELETLESLIHVDSPESGAALAENAARLTRRWSQLAARVPAGVDTSLIVRMWRKETERAADCFTQALERAALSPEARAQAVRPCLEPARSAEALLPAVDAAARGNRSAVLVITSVGCECIMNACARMGALYDSLTTANPGIPFVRFDEMDLPEIAEGWDLYQIPTWVFLEKTGTVAFMLEGTDVDNSTVLSEIRAWTGVEKPAAKK